MTAEQIVSMVLADLEMLPDMSSMTLSEKVFCIGVYRIYKMYAAGTISQQSGKKLKTELIVEFERWKKFEEMYLKSVEEQRCASVAGVKLTKLLQSDADDSEILDAALEVLNVSGLSGGVPWKREER